MEKQVTRNKSQAGFSLIELLVVVAIIGVLAAAGIVGYGKYLDGVKDDTSKNNARAIAQALKTELTILNGNLTAQNCPSASVTSGNFTADADAVSCANLIIGNGKFKDPYSSANMVAGGSCAANTVVVSKNGVQACGKTNAALGDLLSITN